MRSLLRVPDESSTPSAAVAGPPTIGQQRDKRAHVALCLITPVTLTRAPCSHPPSLLSAVYRATRSPSARLPRPSPPPQISFGNCRIARFSRAPSLHPPSAPRASGASAEAPCFSRSRLATLALTPLPAPSPPPFPPSPLPPLPLPRPRRAAGATGARAACRTLCSLNARLLHVPRACEWRKLAASAPRPLLI